MELHGWHASNDIHTTGGTADDKNTFVPARTLAAFPGIAGEKPRPHDIHGVASSTIVSRLEIKKKQTAASPQPQSFPFQLVKRKVIVQKN